MVQRRLSTRRERERQCNAGTAAGLYCTLCAVGRQRGGWNSGDKGLVLLGFGCILMF